jgi:hypothetical protein
VQAVYLAADEQTKRGYNQAFFRKLLITAERDDAPAGNSVRVSGAELTPPYALLLAEGLFQEAEAEAQAIRAGTQNRAGSAERSASPVSIYEQMAGRSGRVAKKRLDRLVHELLEPSGRDVRRRAARPSITCGELRGARRWS